jgi:hypothetical protein
MEGWRDKRVEGWKGGDEGERECKWGWRGGGVEGVAGHKSVTAQECDSEKV